LTSTRIEAHGRLPGNNTSAAGSALLYYRAVNFLGRRTMAFYIFYVVAIVVLILHFTGWLKRNNLEWIVLVLAVATFPAVIFLR
jgi:hypothetical protein